MKDRYGKPLYADYKGQAWYKLPSYKPVLSDERQFEFADRLLIMAIGIEMILAFIFVYCYLPRPDNFIFWLLPALTLYSFAFFCINFFLRRFVYRFGRFKVTWEDLAHTGAACDTCDEYGAFLKTKENRRAAVKSRLAFSALFLFIAAMAAAFYFLTWGMAEQRVSSDAPIQEFMRIAEKQGSASLYVDSAGVEVWADEETAGVISKEDEYELNRIFRELQWNYVEELSTYSKGIHVHMHGGIEHKSFDIPFGQ